MRGHLLITSTAHIALLFTLGFSSPLLFPTDLARDTTVDFSHIIPPPVHTVSLFPRQHGILGISMVLERNLPGGIDIPFTSLSTTAEAA
ncbi:hypothetical protein DL96DRAFT_1649242 [Flagelloscypha sp. PMI_526]|nr:hypothetical protein DL96DRAFT_1649242 [Flagelloscypha sp. PMI_526]